MGLRSVVRCLSKGLERFNNSFGGTAVASGVQTPGGPGSPGVDAASVVAVLGEIEKTRPDTEADRADRDR